MKKNHLTTQPLRGLRRVLLLAGLLASGLGMMLGSSACLPAPTMLQIENFQPCTQGVTRGDIKITRGALDVGTSNSYALSIGLQNMLAVTANTALLTPETNFIKIKEVKVWFEYPSNFSLQANGQQLHTKSSPYIRKVHFRIEPTLRVTQGGTGGAATVEASYLLTNILPSATAKAWQSAAELKSVQTGNRFEVIAHISVSGTSGTGAIMTTEEIEYPIEVCLGCMAVGKCRAPKEPGSAEAACAGQDGICIKKAAPTP